MASTRFNHELWDHVKGIVGFSGVYHGSQHEPTISKIFLACNTQCLPCIDDKFVQHISPIITGLDDQIDGLEKTWFPVQDFPLNQSSAIHGNHPLQGDSPLYTIYFGIAPF